MGALTALRQCCCHPHIVKRKEAGGKQERLSMRQIMSRLVLQVRLGVSCKEGLKSGRGGSSEGTAREASRWGWTQRSSL